MTVLIEKLEKSYDRVILKDINLEIPNGQILGIIGRSGAGKSTLLRCINGLEEPTQGKIYIDSQLFSGIPLQKKRKIQQKIGNVFQSPNLLSRLTVLKNITLPLKLLGKESTESQSKALKLIELVGLKGKEESYPSQLSGGQCQRVAIARALITDTNLLLCDEFTSALDNETSLEILELLKDLNKRLGITIILITHDMAIVREICDEVCVIDKGRIVEKNNITSILLHPESGVTKSLIQNLFNRDLPHHLQEKLRPQASGKSTALIRLLFSSDSAGEPIISSLVTKHHVPINILFGNLDHIRETAFGCLIVEIPNDAEKLCAIREELHQKEVSTEVIGYLPASENQKWNN